MRASTISPGAKVQSAGSIKFSSQFFLSRIAAPEGDAEHSNSPETDSNRRTTMTDEGNEREAYETLSKMFGQLWDVAERAGAEVLLVRVIFDTFEDHKVLSEETLNEIKMLCEGLLQHFEKQNVAQDFEVIAECRGFATRREAEAASEEAIKRKRT
jgi:hypothetical protein